MSVGKGSMSAGNFHAKLIWGLFVFLSACSAAISVDDYWKNVICNEHMQPDNCELNMAYVTVEDYDRCAPARLPINVRNYYLGWSGRGITYRDNRDAFERLKILPQFMLDTSDTSLETTVLGKKIDYPIGISPTGFMKFANPAGEIATAKAAQAEKAVMILSSYATISMEDVAKSVNMSAGNYWMQLYIYKDRSATVNVVRRAEKLGFKALVLSVDSNIVPSILCDAKSTPEVLYTKLPNAPGERQDFFPSVTTFQDIRWLNSITSLPIVAKGVLTGEDATKAINAGASAIFVSNHGGRQLDGTLASIDALPDVVRAVNKIKPRRDVYLDGGVRNGFDVYKALARGAKMVFVGRPTLWGLTVAGENGIKKMLGILRSEFNATMILSGATNPSKIQASSVACNSCKNTDGLSNELY